MKNTDKYPIVYCVWEDITSTSTDWRELDDAIQWMDAEDSLVSQVGFMIEKNDDYLVLMDSFFHIEDTIGSVTRIPKNAVKFIKQITINEFKDEPAIQK